MRDSLEKFSWMELSVQKVLGMQTGIIYIHQRDVSKTSVLSSKPLLPIS